MRSISTRQNQIIEASPSHLITCYYDAFIGLKQFGCVIIKIPNDQRQMVVSAPGVGRFKLSNTRTSRNHLPSIIWNFYDDTTKLLQADEENIK